MGAEHPNVVWIMADSYRAESAHCYGNANIHTPNLDGLAESGVLFENAYTPYPVCGPARCAVVAGLYPRATGVRGNDYVLEAHHPNLFRAMHCQGYYTAWFGKNDLFSEGLFEGVMDEVAPPACWHGFGERIYTQEGAPGYYSFLRKQYSQDITQNADYEVWKQADSFLRSYQEERPFMLFLPLSMPHVPFTMVGEYQDMYTPEDVAPLRPAGLEGEPDTRRLFRAASCLDDFDQQSLKKCGAVYMGMVSYADYILGKIIQSLKESGRYDDTVIIYCSDHGEYAGDYGCVSKTMSGVEDTQSRVPLVIAGPGIEHRRVKQPVSLIDLNPTIADLCGIEKEHPCHGTSLKPLLYGGQENPDTEVFFEGGCHLEEEESNLTSEEHAYFSQHPDDEYYPLYRIRKMDPHCEEPVVGLRTMDYKMVYRPHSSCELYDIRKDPKEVRNLYGDPSYRELRERMEKRILQWCVDTSDFTPHHIRHSRQTPQYKAPIEKNRP